MRPLNPAPRIVLAHAAYRLGEELAARHTGLAFVEVRDKAGLAGEIAAADIAVVSGLWTNDLIAKAPRLAFVQSISAGTDQYDRRAFKEAGIRLASAQGANEKAVAEHAMALMLALKRHLHLARDRQREAIWRPMIGERAAREDELAGKTLVIVGLGRIGARLARLASAFDMRVIGVRRSGGQPPPGVAALATPDELIKVAAEADVLALTCPLTPETRGIISAAVLAALPVHALLINVARGPVVDEAALTAALADGRLAGAGLDCFVEEPLPATSPLWALSQVLITPHAAGETRAYETNIIDLLLANLDHVQRGETLVNAVV